MATVELVDVSLRFGKKSPLLEFSLAVEPGEMCVLVGPSGCGKTLALRVTAGLESPSSGDVKIEGRSVLGLAPGKRNVAMIFQNYALYEHMTVWENFAFPLQAARVSREEIKKRVESVAECLYMTPFLDRFSRELSGGQQQRVAIGRALVKRPSIFLMDEPLGNLDAKLRMELRGVLKQLQQGMSTTTLYVTHDQGDAQAIADKIVVMREGRVQQVGPPEEIYEQPKNMSVARFVGIPPINFFDCELQHVDGRLTARHEAFVLPLAGATAQRIVSQGTPQQVVVGVRPEDMRLSATDGPGAIAVTVYVIEPQSNELIVDLKLGDAILKARVDRDQLGFMPKTDQVLCLTLDPGRVHVFDKRSGERIG